MLKKEEYQISFIIPVYNVAIYLHDCIESILKQSIKKKEIILVNNGSTDDSFKICEYYQEKYDFIRVVDLAVTGVSYARNEGIKMARGKYICFVDGDDFYIKDFATEFFEICEEKELDVIRGIYCLYYENKTFDHCNLKKLSYFDDVLKGIEFLEKSIVEDYNEVVPVLGFYRKAFLIENNIFFPEGIIYEEDHVFFLKILLEKQCKILQRNTEFYAYRMREGSASNTPSVKKAVNVVDVVKEEIRLAKRVNMDNNSYVKSFISSSFYQLTSIYGRVSLSDRKKIKDLCKKEINKEYVTLNYNRHLKIKIFLFLNVTWFVDLVYFIKFKI